MKAVLLNTVKEVYYVLASLTRWDNALGEQARRLYTWKKKGWLREGDLLAAVNSLLEEAEGFGLISKKDVARLLSHKHIEDMIEAVTRYSSDQPQEEALALYMLTAREKGTDVEKAFTMYLDFKEQYGQELEDWKKKFDFIVTKTKETKKIEGKKRDGKLSIMQLRTINKEKHRERLAKKRKMRELKEWIAEKELTRPWEEERKLLPGLEEAEFDTATNKGTDNGEH